jgi:nitroimidazol reductase NimA-like FMN-containing flavoprotein (pyridoxamine 5'-phosphate oxidase superfamily)
MRDMSEAERRAFLTHGTRTGKLATVRADGSPHVVPIWFTLDHAAPAELLVQLPPTRVVARADIVD